MALEFPDDFPFSRRAPEPVAEPVIEPVVEQQPAPAPAAAAPVAEAAPAQFIVSAPAPAVADVIAQTVAQAVVQAVTAQPAAAAAIAAPAPTPVVAADPVPDAATKAQEAAMGRTDGGPPVGMKERRRVPRQTLVAKAIVRSESQLTTVAAGFVSNISMAGVGFHTRKPLAVGEKFQIRLEVGPMKWASRLRVVTCRQHGDTYDVGAEFVGNELASLGRRELAA